MLLSRFWTILLSAALSFAVAGVLLAREAQVRSSETATSSRVERDRGIVKLLLRLESRQRAAALVRISSASAVRVALARPNALLAETEGAAEARRRLRGTLQTLNSEMSEMAGEIIFALDARGRIVAQLGDSPEDRPAGAGLGQFPLASQALRGFLRDDVWVYNDKVYAMVGRPVIHSGRLVGAVLHGREMNDEFARIIARKLPSASSLFLYRGEQVIGSASGANASDTSEALLPSQAIEQALAVMNTEDADSAEESQAVRSVADGSGVATFGPFTGSAAHAGVGYALGTTVPTIPGPLRLILDAPEQDLGALPIIPLAGSTVVLILLGLLFIYLERDRPMRAFASAVEKLASGDQGRFEISQFRSKFRTFANQLNDAIDLAVQREGGKAPKESNANIDALLGDSDSQSYFGFADLEDRASIPAAPEMLDAIESEAAAQPSSAMQSLPPENLMTLPPEEFMTIADDKAPEKAAAPAAPPIPKEAQDQEMEREPEEEETSDEVEPAENTDGEAHEDEPAENTDEEAHEDEPAENTAEEAQEDEPAENTAEEAHEESESVSEVQSEEESHFIDTFQKYIDLREECGESTAGITFERLRSTLEKNRDKILTQHPDSVVRFTVYVKNGRAAIKAKRQV